MKYVGVQVVIYVMRMILLIAGLNLIGHKILHPVFVAICGLIQAFCATIKSMRSKKNYYKLEVEDLKKQLSENKNK